MSKLSDILIPLPQKIEEGDAKFKVSAFGGKVVIKTGVKCDLIASARDCLEKRLNSLAAVTADGKRGDYKITVTVDGADSAFDGIESDEAYYVKTSKREALLVGKTPAGAYYAAVTFADMLTECEGNVTVPEAYVLDWPDFKYRGHTLESRFGTEFLTREDYYEIIDYFAAQKINRLMPVLYDCWGFQYDNDPAEYLYVPIPGHPEIKTPTRIKYYSVKEQKWINKNGLLPSMYKEDFLGDVVAYGKKKNVTVVPMTNSLGHNTLIPRMIPEISAKNEDGTSKNWGYCTSSEETYNVLFAWMDSIIDKYVLPYGNNELHLGLDEVPPTYKCECPRCRDLERTDIFIDHAIKMIRHAKERGMKRVYIYHDMFLSYDAVTDETKQRFIDGGVDDVTVIDWWTYEDPTAGLFFGKADKVRPIMKSMIKPYTSYQNWTVAQDCFENIRGTVKLAIGQGFEGSCAYSTYDRSFDKNFCLLADISWNNANVDGVEQFEARYAEKRYPNNKEKALTALRAMRDIMIDEVHNNYQNRTTRWLEVYPYCYRIQNRDEKGRLLSLDIKNFPGDIYDRLKRSDRVDVAYLELLYKNSAVAIDFFENSGTNDKYNDAWLLTARHINRLADEYLSMLAVSAEYDRGACPVKVVDVLNRLITERESLMAFAEDVKERAQSYMYLRNMSHFRQYLVDLRDYFCREINAGKRPKLDLCDLNYAMSERFAFLR